MPNVGPMELIVVLVIALLVLGPRKLPEVGRSVGRGIREFKSSIGGDSNDAEEDRDLAALRASAAPAEPVAPAATEPAAAAASAPAPAATAAPTVVPEPAPVAEPVLTGRRPE